jgi:hypothetical protein
MRQLKLLPGTMLLLLASTFSINPVSAQQTPTGGGTGEIQNPTDTSTQQTPSGTTTQPVTTPTQMEKPSAPGSTPMQMEPAAPSSTETTNTVSGTIKSIKGEVVTVAMADGVTKEMKVSKSDLQRLNLQKGMEISATVDAQSKASNITLAQSSPSSTGAEATGSEAGSTSTTNEATPTTPATTDTSNETPTTNTENTSSPTESAPANRPVRALW